MLNKVVAGCLVASVSIIVAFVALNFNSFFVNENRATGIDVLNVSASAISRIDNAVLNDPLIAGVHIQTIDFQRNIRVETYLRISNPYFDEIYKQYINNKTVEAPLFTQHKDLNSRIMQLINGEFLCIPFSQSVAAITMPTADKYVKVICSIGIPPYHFNNFAGILTVYLTSAPSKPEVDNIFLFARSVSIDIANSNISLSK
jgi:hypothetical protein